MCLGGNGGFMSWSSQGGQPCSAVDSLCSFRLSDISRRGFMSTAQIAIGDSISERDFRGLPSGLRRAQPTMRLERIRAMAGELFEEAESLDCDQAFAEASAMPDNLELDSGIDFFDQVRRFEIQLIKLALNRCNGNQSRAARLLGLGSTTLNYKIKSYEIENRQ